MLSIKTQSCWCKVIVTATGLIFSISVHGRFMTMEKIVFWFTWIRGWVENCVVVYLQIIYTHTNMFRHLGLLQEDPSSICQKGMSRDWWRRNRVTLKVLSENSREETRCGENSGRPVIGETVAFLKHLSRHQHITKNLSRLYKTPGSCSGKTLTGRWIKTSLPPSAVGGVRRTEKGKKKKMYWQKEKSDK